MGLEGMPGRSRFHTGLSITSLSRAVPTAAAQPLWRQQRTQSCLLSFSELAWEVQGFQPAWCLFHHLGFHRVSSQPPLPPQCLQQWLSWAVTAHLVAQQHTA